MNWLVILWTIVGVAGFTDITVVGFLQGVYKIKSPSCRVDAIYKDVRKSSSITAMSSGRSTVDLTGNGAVRKEVIVPGTGKAVEPGDILAAAFSAKIKGGDRPFAKGDQEKFVVKDGSMIKGWDVAVESMKIGETARFICKSQYAYGEQGIGTIIPPNSDIEIELKVVAWLGNQLRPESLFAKDLDIDPFIASTPESIQAEYDEMQVSKENKYAGSIFDIYLRRIKSISFGFGGSNFFASQSGEKAPWYLNPNLTFPSMILFVIVAFVTVFSSGAVREKGIRSSDLDVDVAVIQNHETGSLLSDSC